MSQKTNPLSLRLQKANRHFASPWFTDSFFSDTFQYEFMIRKYLALLLQETQYSINFFSAKNYYRKTDIAFSIQDFRAEKKEKSLVFNLKSGLLKKKSLSDNLLSSTPAFIASSLWENASSEALMKQSLFRKRVRNELLSFKLNPIKVTYNNFTLSKTFICTPYFWSLLYLPQKEKKVKLPIAKSLTKGKSVLPSQKVIPSVHATSLFSVLASETLIYNNNAITNEVFKNRVMQRDLFTYCEKILKQEQIREDKKKGFTETLCFEPIRFVNTAQSVTALLDRIVGLLEKRVSFKDIKAKAFKDVENKRFIKGVRFTCSGRLGGRSKKAQKAKMQSYQWGETSLNAFSSNLVFDSKSATTPYGKVGVKLWLSFTH